MSAPAASSPTFTTAAQSASVRVWLRQSLTLMVRTRWYIGGFLAFLIGWQLAGGSAIVPWLAWLSIALWAAACATHAWWRRPGAFPALALWDRATHRREAFATAWWLEQKTAPLTEAEAHHIATQRQLLPQALPTLARDLPLRWDRWLLLAPVLALIVTSIAVVIGPSSSLLLVDDAMEQAALAEAKKLAQTDWSKKKLEGLKEDEQKELNDLKSKIQETAQSLENAAGKDARNVMADLEKRARDAEKLAEKLAANKDAWASEKLVQEMRKHADTADTGDAVAAKSASQTAKAAEALAQQLKDPALTNDTRERLNATLQEIQAVAENEDRQRIVGQHVLTASDQLRQTQAAQAGAEFEKLADKMRDLALREQSRKELEKLAQQLRDAGSNIAGQNQAGGMQEMAAAGQQQQQSGQSGQAGQGSQSPQVPQSQPGQQVPQSLQPPGLGQQSPQNGQSMMAPVPGTQPPGQPGQQMQLVQGAPGQTGKPGDKPMLFAPIPGQKPGDKPDVFLLGPPGQNPGDGPPMTFAIPGGPQPGVGKADLNADPTAKQKVGNQSLVTAQQGKEGQSSVRTVEGGTRQEQASRTATQTAAEFLAAEEAALDEASLPPARREQIRRYFTELRKRFEKQP